MLLTLSLSYYVNNPYYYRSENAISEPSPEELATRKQRMLSFVINCETTFFSRSVPPIITSLFDRQQVGRKRAAGDIQVEMVVNFQQMVTQSTRDMVRAANVYFEWNFFFG